MLRHSLTSKLSVLLIALLLTLGIARPSAHAASQAVLASAPPTSVEATVSGVVTLSGVGLSGVTITAKSVGGPSWLYSTTTNSGGAYSLVTPTGTFDVSASRFGYTFTGPFRFSSSSGSAIFANTNFVATRLPIYTVSGVAHSGGSGLAGVPVSVFFASSVVTNTFTASDGSYSVRIPAGTYTLTAQSFGYAIASPISATVATTDVNGIDFAATRLFYTIGGNVNLDGVGLSGVTVSTQLSTTQITNTTTASDGSYVLHVPIGTYTITAELPGYSFSTPLSATVTTEDVSGKNFSATRLFYTVSGVVTSGGAVLPGVQLSCDGTNAVTGATGVYTLSGLRYGACVLAPALTGYTFAPPFVPLNVTGNSTGQNFVATPIPLFTIGGRILDTQSGEAVSGVQVTDGARTTFTDLGGFYTLTGVPAGTYIVSAAKSGYRLSDAATVVIGNANVDAINFSATQNVTVHDVSGEVRPFSSGIASQCVSGVQIAYGVGSTVTPGDGRFALLGLPPGTYAITPIKVGCSYSPPTQIVTVTNTSIANVIFAEQQKPVSVYSINGRATTPDGTGLGGTRIAYGTTFVLADAQGYFTIPNLTANTYVLIPTLRGYRFEPATLPITITNSNVVIASMQGRLYTSRNWLPIAMRIEPIVVCAVAGADCGLEPDNAVRAGATQLPTSNATFYARIGSSADVRDVYGFVLTAGIRYRFSVTHRAVGDINAYFYDEKSSAPLLSSAQLGTSNETITFTPSVTGRYFLQVVAASVRVKSDYQLTVAY
jgi:hypothetical protein